MLSREAKMKNTTGLFLVLFVFLGTFFIDTSPADAFVYYVRPDGGDGEHCNGLADAPYPGSGKNQPCAWSHPFWAVSNLYVAPSWKLAGGDTLIISPGSYMIGYGAPNTQTCNASGAFGCVLPPLPSGPDRGHPTRILGKGWDQGCPSPPELWGTERVYQVLDLTGTSNALIACLEITDHSGCVEFHANPEISCERDSAPFGKWASTGILSSDSINVTLKNLNIHGLAHTGILASRLNDWTVEDVRLAANGWVGWDGDIYGNDGNKGVLKFTRWLVEWNGCAETYPGRQPDHCWDQNAGGYGDGVGTGATGGRWIIEDSIFRHNTSDGLDLLYVGRIPGEISQIEVRRSMSYGNAGNQVKTNGPTSIENCLMVSNCTYFADKPFGQEMSLHCRAGGAALALGVGKGNQVSVVNSTIAGEGDCLGGFECSGYPSKCDGSEKLLVFNNIFRGYRDFSDPDDLACYFWFDRDNFYDVTADANMIYNAKINDSMPLGPNDSFDDPLFVEDDLNHFDGHLQSASPAMDTGLPIGSYGGLIPVHDLEGNARPQGGGVDRGAYELVSGEISPPIIQQIEASPKSGVAPLKVGFSALFSGEVMSWKWDFGDGTTSTEKAPTHTYLFPGIYSVSLTVTGPGGSSEALKPDFISVLSPITVVSPNGGEKWRAGRKETIRWKAFGKAGSYVKIELLRNGASVLRIQSKAKTGTGGTGTYRWLIPRSLVTGADYRIRISSFTDGVYWDVSDNNFSISR